MPIIATETGGPCEIIDANKNGFLVAPNEFGFAEGMKKLILDKKMARNMGITGYNSLDERYGVGVVNKAFNEILG